MADLTDAQVAYLTSELGTDVDLDDAQDRYDRSGDVRDVVLEVLRQRLADYVAAPASLRTPEGLTVGTSANITALTDQMKRVQSEGDPDDDGSVQGNVVTQFPWAQVCRR